MGSQASINVPPTLSTNSKSDIELTNKTDSLVLDILSKVGPKTRNELVSETSIARSTLYDSLLRLILKGYVSKFSETPQGPGRPKVFFQSV